MGLFSTCWEREEGYPDITLLPSIAGYFGVTVDTVCGLDAEREKEEIEEKDSLRSLQEEINKIYLFSCATEDHPLFAYKWSHSIFKV